MKCIYQIIEGLLLYIQTISVQVALTPKRTEIVMMVGELRYFLEQVGKAELTALRGKQLDSVLSAVNYKTKQMSPTSVIIDEYQLIKAAAVSPTVVGTTSSTITSRMASNTATARTVSNTTVARTADSTIVHITTNTIIIQHSVVPATVAQTRTTVVIAQQLAQLSGMVEQLRKRQQLFLVTLVVSTGMAAAKSNTAPTATNAQATAVGTQAAAAITTATMTTSGYAPIVIQSVIATGVPIQISAEECSELEQLLTTYGCKKALFYFANNKMIPLAYNLIIIDEMVTMLQVHPELSVLSGGYAGAVGDAACNSVLSMERAVVVTQTPNAKGISNERILTAFKGIDPQATPAQARHVEPRVAIRSY